MDLDKLRSKLEQLKNPGSTNFTSNIWKPKKDGEESRIRLIHYPFSDDPFVELWFYYGIGQGPGILSPRRMSGRSDPIWDLAQELRESGDEKDLELAKTLSPKQRIYAVVVDRDDPSQTPKYWGFGKMVYQELLEKIFNEEYGNYMDPNKGIDITVKSEKKAGKRYPETSLTFSRRETPLADSEDKIDKILKSIKPIEDVFKPMATAEIKKRLQDWLSFSEEEVVNEDSGETVRKASSNSSGGVYNVEEELEKALENSQQVPA